MSTIAVNTFMTLDGVAQAPGGRGEDRTGGFEHGGWQVPYFTEELGRIIGPWFSGAGGYLLGRKTYDIFGAYWPYVPEGDEEYGMAKIINDTPKYVASRSTVKKVWDDTTPLTGDVPAAVAELKARDLGELQVAGSLDFAQTLMRHNLVDEFRLAIFPVVLGSGKRLFADGAVPSALKLVSQQTTDAGVIAAVFRPEGEPTYGSYEL